jgi:hypothetical protein
MGDPENSILICLYAIICCAVFLLCAYICQFVNRQCTTNIMKRIWDRNDKAEQTLLPIESKNYLTLPE